MGSEIQRPEADREKARHEARGQTKRKKAERPDGQSERNTNTQTLENTRSAIKNIPREKEEIWMWNVFCENNLSVIYMLLI